jgi:hypothetical protein
VRTLRQNEFRNDLVMIAASSIQTRADEGQFVAFTLVMQTTGIDFTLASATADYLEYLGSSSLLPAWVRPACPPETRHAF